MSCGLAREMLTGIAGVRGSFGVFGGSCLYRLSRRPASAGLFFCLNGSSARLGSCRMSELYARWIYAWEHRLASRDTNRVVRPFEWGQQWLGADEAGDPGRIVGERAAAAAANSEEFYSYRPPRTFHQQNGTLRFQSALETPYPENNEVWADWFPAAGSGRRAVVVVPQWNADRASHRGLCQLLNRGGISALKLTKPYHGNRKPPELERADYLCSSNVGRTIHAVRQGVIDVRSCVDWLTSQGYERVGIVGTSLGSCVAFLAVAHDSRFRAGAFNHVSGHFSEVVWTGLSTAHVRQGLEQGTTRQELLRLWAVISPATYLDRMAGREFQALLVWAKHDPVFLPEFSRFVIEEFRSRGLPHREVCLPCGHYTLGRFPFNLMDGMTICRYLYKKL